MQYHPGWVFQSNSAWLNKNTELWSFISWQSKQHNSEYDMNTIQISHLGLLSNLKNWLFQYICHANVWFSDRNKSYFKFACWLQNITRNTFCSTHFPSVKTVHRNSSVPGRLSLPGRRGFYLLCSFYCGKIIWGSP